jgi:Papain-like cysteine protease AvrRpt2
MHYVVPHMKLIPQDKTMSCWYASGQMVIEWRRSTTRMTEMSHPDPSQVPKWQNLYNANPGISNPQIVSYARDLGLRAVPPMSPTPEAILEWLKRYGPLWVNGKLHITVIAGIKKTKNSYKVLVFDPGNPRKTHGEWRDLYKWYVNDPHSGRDSDHAVEAVFLYAPS